MIRVTTESGRVYEINLEDGFWRRLPKQEGEYTGGVHRLWALMVGDNLAFPWNDPSFKSAAFPVVGKHMFISGRDVWWTSTKVVSVEVMPDGGHPSGPADPAPRSLDE